MRKRLILYLLIPPVVVALFAIYFKNKPLAASNTTTPTQQTPQTQKDALAQQTPQTQKDALAQQTPQTQKDAPKPSSAPTPESQPTPIKFPRSWNDVLMTEKLAQALERLRQNDQPDIYERLDYRLRFFASFADCLGNYRPAEGELLINLLFVADLNRKIAVGVGADEFQGEGALEAFNVRESTFQPVDEAHMIKCAINAHIGEELDMRNTSLSLEMLAQVGGFYFPTFIRFPLEENDVYWMISHEGEHRPTAKLIRNEQKKMDQ